MVLSAGSRSKLWILMITAFIDMVGLLMVIPLLPFYAKSLGAGGLVVGTLISSFAVAQLISAPMWGRFSDAYGRRPALLVGLGASVIAYIIFAFALSLPHPLFFLFLSRIVQGAGGGTVSVIQAYVADATAPEERAKALGWLSAATIFGRWDPMRAGLACLLFAAAETLQIQLQGSQAIPSQFVEMIPYALTIVALAGVVGRAVAPAALGKTTIE